MAIFKYRQHNKRFILDSDDSNENPDAVLMAKKWIEKNMSLLTGVIICRNWNETNTERDQTTE